MIDEVAFSPSDLETRDDLALFPSNTYNRNGVAESHQLKRTLPQSYPEGAHTEL